jgi:hypothetical protein
MTTGIRQAGLEHSPLNPKMNELNSQARSKQDKVADGSVGVTDTVKITASVSEKPVLKFDPIDEEQATILSQLVANDLNKQSVGISAPEGMDALRSFI